jgi:hypothetical protein
LSIKKNLTESAKDERNAYPERLIPPASFNKSLMLL